MIHSVNKAVTLDKVNVVVFFLRTETGNLGRVELNCNMVNFQTVQSTFKPDVVPAVNRWLKKAGKEGR